MNVSYKYFGLKLTPNVFSDLLIELFDGTQFKRDVAISKILKYHQENGGSIENVNGVAVFKKATQKLKDSGIENLGYGVWKLTYYKLEVVLDESHIETQKIDIKPDKEIGSGDYSVYLYYFDSYRNLAELKGETYWQCKVGRTDKEPVQRIISQSGTCFPESPHIALVIYCNNSQQLESALHNILKLRNKWIESAPGVEWFYTNPNEVEELYKLIHNN